MESVSIIVPTCNRSGLLRYCLEGIAAQTALPPDIEVIVVNDGGTAPTWSLSDLPMKVKYIEQANNGPASARNTGARKSRGSILVFIDDDCVPRPDWLATLLSIYEKHPDASGVSGTLTTGSMSTAVDHWEVREFVPLFNKLNSALDTTFSEEGRVWFHFGCNASYRREVFFRMNGFDESLRMMEDTDFHWRLHEMDLSLYYTPKSIVEHNGQKHFIGELRRCYRGGIAYRNYCRLHPGYRPLISDTGAGSGGLIKSTFAAITRAASYSSRPRVRVFFVVLTIMHRFMYALGYLSRTSTAVSPVVNDCRSNNEVIAETGNCSEVASQFADR